MSRILDVKDPRKHKGRPRKDQRRILDGIIFKIRTGCGWNLIPKVYGSDTTIYRALSRWIKLGVWQVLWNVLVEESPELARVEWKNEIQDDPVLKNEPPSSP
jgi:putative transposase